MKYWLVFIFCLLKEGVADQPKINLPEYTALGFQHQTDHGFEANVFLGLPYAKAPVGELRFEKPQPLSATPSKIINATAFPLGCHPIEQMPGMQTSEDCLYLNIMTPSNSHPDELFPVLVFIHGGGFSFGNSEFYGYKTYIHNFVSQKIIMVTLQYRLAHFGFFATEDFEISGNFAHFDQMEALKFVQRNIKSFGGDPSRITLSGHSCGSISVQALSLSPQSRHLFSRQVYMAGNINVQWVTSTKVFTHSKEIAKAVGCEQENSKELKACLKTIKYEDFWKARKDLNVGSFRPTFVFDYLYWNPVFDNDLFDGKTYDELLPLQLKNDVMYGITAREGLLFTLISGHPVTSIFSLLRGFTVEGRRNANAETIRTFLKELFTTKTFPENVKEEILKEIFDFYQIGDHHKGSNELHYFEKWNDVLGDVFGGIAMTQELLKQYRYGFKNQFLYILNYTRPQDRHIVGDQPPHGYEHLYFSGHNAYNLHYDAIFSEEEKLLQKQFSQLFITFIKSGKPNVDGILVPTITEKEIPFIEFSPKPKIKKGHFEPMVEFWEKLMEKHGYNFILGFPLSKKETSKNEL